MNPIELEKYEKYLMKKGWELVVRSAIKIYKFNQKEKMDAEQSCRRLSQHCIREVKRKFAKSLRIQKEYVFRGKRLQREMLTYWRKKEKELNEIKKKKEKLEIELMKREEEERENLLQKKRLEFLMKQSEIYMHFMEKKLGIETEKETDKVYLFLNKIYIVKKKKKKKKDNILHIYILKK